MIELEKTYLAKYLPRDLIQSPHQEIVDIYWPIDYQHPNLRLRKNGDKYELTKKEPINNDASRQQEQTIIITKDEFDDLVKLPGKESTKIRYYYPYQNLTAEFTVFQKKLTGLVLIDFEFKTEEAKNNFSPPDYCLADVTYKEFVAGGMLCGKSYQDIEAELQKFNYQKQCA